MVLTAAMTDRALLNGRLLDILHTEQRLTARVDRLVDDYSFSKRGWRRETLDLDETIFDSAEYVKDGLIPVTEWLGESPWSQRAIGIIEDIWKHAEVQTPFGRIPTLNFEVNGDLLQSNSRLYWLTGDRKYLDWAIRLGDYYLLGQNHPTRDMEELRLRDHGGEVVNGLTELYVILKQVQPEKAQAYREPMHAMFERILAVGRNEHGMFYDWEPGNADGYADTIESALNLFNREPVAGVAQWLDQQTRMMWARQQLDGLIDAYYPDGNFARTTLMYALWKTAGLTIEPWRADVRFGAVRGDDGRLYISLTADRPWSGRLIFDRPRHRTDLHLPLDYPRINQFPEWFTVEAERQYQVRGSRARQPARHPGRELIEGLVISLPAGSERHLEIRPED